MKYLNKNIENLSKIQNEKSLVRTSASCGIFQDCDYSKNSSKLYHQNQIDNKE